MTTYESQRTLCSFGLFCARQAWQQLTVKNFLFALGIYIGFQALTEWIVRHIFFACLIVSGLTIWGWYRVNENLRKAEQAKDGSDMLWGFTFLWALVAMMGMPLVLAKTAPQWLRDWIITIMAPVNNLFQ